MPPTDDQDPTTPPPAATPKPPADGPPPEPVKPVAKGVASTYGKAVHHEQDVLEGWDPDADLDPVDAGEWHEEAAKRAARTPAPPPKPEPHRHPKALLVRARRNEFTQAEIDATPTAELERQVSEVEDKLAEHEARYAPRREPREPAEAARPAPRPAPPPEPEPEIDWGEEEAEEVDDEGNVRKVKRKLTEADFNGSLVGVLKGYAKEIQSLKKAVARRDQQEQAERVASEFDKRFAAFPEVFGDKPMAALDPNSPEAIRRLAVFQQVTLRVKGGQQFGEAFDAVKAALYPDAGRAAPKKAARQEEPADEPPETPPARRASPPRNRATRQFVPVDADAQAAAEADYDNNALAAPTNRADTALPYGDERALKNLIARSRRNGSAADDD